MIFLRVDFFPMLFVSQYFCTMTLHPSLIHLLKLQCVPRIPVHATTVITLATGVAPISFINFRNRVPFFEMPLNISGRRVERVHFIGESSSGIKVMCLHFIASILPWWGRVWSLPCLMKASWLRSFPFLSFLKIVTKIFTSHTVNDTSNNVIPLTQRNYFLISPRWN